MTATATSRKAYREITDEGKITRQQSALLSSMRPGRDYSLQELVKASGMQINVVSGRANELRHSGHLTTTHKRKCTITGRTVLPVAYPEGVLFW